MSLAEIIPTIINLVVTRHTDSRIRVTLYQAGVPTSLQGDTVTFLAKNRPGGAVKIDIDLDLDVQDGDTLGQAMFTLPRALLVGAGHPNDDPTDDVVWVYEVRRSHLGLISVPIAGTLTLADTI